MNNSRVLQGYIWKENPVIFVLHTAESREFPILQSMKSLQIINAFNLMEFIHFCYYTDQDDSQSFGFINLNPKKLSSDG